jgi:hypothetical protein
MPWWIVAGAGVIVVVAAALWWWLPKWQVNLLRLKIRDPKARADEREKKRRKPADPGGRGDAKRLCSFLAGGSPHDLSQRRVPVVSTTHDPRMASMLERALLWR